MSSNGLALFFLVAIGSVLMPSPAVVPLVALALGIAFVASRGTSGFLVLKRAALTVLPIVLLLGIVWIGVAGHAPDATIFYRPDGVVSAWTGVAAIAARLFLVGLFTFAAAHAGARIKPSFVNGLAAPRRVRVLLLATASLADVMRQGSQRAHTALVAANVLTGRLSLRNGLGAWLLLRTTWVAALGIADERLNTKWLHEDLPAALPLGPCQGLNRVDLAWLTAALVSLAATAYGLGG